MDDGGGASASAGVDIEGGGEYMTVAETTTDATATTGTPSEALSAAAVVPLRVCCMRAATCAPLPTGDSRARIVAVTVRLADNDDCSRRRRVAATDTETSSLGTPTRLASLVA